MTAVVPSPTGHTLLPHNTEAEESVLGAMMLSHDAALIAVGMLTSSDFYRPSHAHIFDAVRSLLADAHTTGPLEVADRLRRAGLLDSVGGSGELVALQSGAPTTTNVEHYARIVEEHSTMRRLIGAAGEMMAMGYAQPDDVEEALGKAQQMLYEISSSRSVDAPQRIGDAITPWIDDMEARASNQKLRGIRSGLHAIDMRIGGGAKPGHVYVVAARPGVGKSVLLMQWAGLATHRGSVVHMANVEMSRHEVLDRLVAQMGVPASQLTSPSKSTPWERVGTYARTVAQWPIRVVDVGKQTPQRVIADAIKVRRDEGGLSMIVVDYLQQLTIETGRNGTRDQAIGEAMYLFKAAARELNVPILIAVQLSRLAEKDNRRPRLSDLRESGSIEQAADVVMALHEPKATGRAVIPYRECIFLKNRQGPQGIVKLGWVPSRTLLVNAARTDDLPDIRPDEIIDVDLFENEPF